MRTGTVVVVASSVLWLALVGCGDGSGPSGPVTYWQNVAPIYNAKCVRCHQEGGFGPFPLNDYAQARARATLSLARVTEGTMPPYFMVHDGSCGEFHDETTLTGGEKATIAAWVNGGQLEGTPVTLAPPARPTLPDAVDVVTPSFSPVAQGTDLALHDEYRCFLMDPPVASDSFLTGYDVTPGDTEIVHHVLVFVVNPQAPGGGGTNAAVMQALDAASPDRLGWPCFGTAGEGIEADGVPVTWAPGQGVVSYPEGMGVPIRATDKLVVQMHYNLAEPGTAGRTDSSRIHLRFASRVARQLAFLLPDPFLDSLSRPTPDSLPPGSASASYTWTLTGRELGLVGIPSVTLMAVMPHMHGRGLRQTLRIGPPGDLACAARLENWDFHWQEFYFYERFPVITPTTQVQLTCEYDTSADTTPVLPGWGTRNEMCLAVMMVALPPG